MLNKKVCIILISLFFPVFIFAQTQTAIFAMGCFWCAQHDFDEVKGVIKTVVGYEGGSIQNPTYQLVSAGKTNYAEAIKVEYDSDLVSYQELLNHFWANVDPTVNDQQFCDKGHQYRSEIFYLNESQKQLALSSLEKIKPKFQNVYTQVNPATQFYPAEEYHQDYYKKNPVRYNFYRWNCGRDKRLKEVWK